MYQGKMSVHGTPYGRQMTPSNSHPVQSPPVASGRDPVNRQHTTPVIRLLCGTADFKGEYFSGPKLIR